MKFNYKSIIFIIFTILYFNTLCKSNIDTIPTNIFSGLKFRNICPSFISGRIADVAVNPFNHSEYYVAAASGGIWKTVNNGLTFNPVFDDYGSYSIGCITIDPSNPNTIWVGTGENTHQRSVSYGDGIYKSTDGGKTWKNMGLKESFQIGKIIVHPKESETIFVACEGSVWDKGGDRGIFKSTDGGKTWKKIHYVDEYTGFSNIDMDPTDPNTIYASAEQRMRRNQTRIGGGPGSSLWKTIDGGDNWRKLDDGIPSVEKGGMTIAVSPVDHNVVYAMVETAADEGGFFRSVNKGESWEKMSDYVTYGQYYCEIYPSPFDKNTVYSVETVSKFTTDGGKTWNAIGNNKRHVDDHVFWMDPSDENHFMIGTDGGLYETFDGGKNYNHKLIPVTQYYRVFADNTEPFYWIYGGTQDNSSMGVASNTAYDDGISRGEWVITLGGDGFWQAVDPSNSNIVYSEYQYGNLFRVNKVTGDKTDIKPREGADDTLYKWNWNTPFIISKHNPSRLYIAANYLFKTDDRGMTWTKISSDLTTGMDRNSWPVMDKYWGVDAVQKDVSTSLYGTSISLAESPIKEGLIYVGTDDGALNITDDEGKTWKKVLNIGDAPQYTYISDIEPSLYDENIVYITLDNHRNADFKPYVLKSTDKGKSWKSIVGNLGSNLPVHSIKQDFVKKDLLFLGTEFGLYFTIDEGKQWIKLKSGLPTISIEDIDFNRKENDLALASFGRGFFILDDYSSLRSLDEKTLKSKFNLFDIPNGLLYVEKDRGGYGFGSVEYFDQNQPFGVTFTYYSNDEFKSIKEKRREKEKELAKNNQKIPIPTPDQQRIESEESEPVLVFVIKDNTGAEVRKLNTKLSKGINRLTWDLKFSSPEPVNIEYREFDPIKTGRKGILAPEGLYSVDVIKSFEGKFDTLVFGKKFKITSLNLSPEETESSENLLAYYKQASKLNKRAEEAKIDLSNIDNKIKSLRQLANNNPRTSSEVITKLFGLQKTINDIKWKVYGENPKASEEERIPQPVPMNDRFNYIAGSHDNTLQKITETERNIINIVERELPILENQISKIKDNEIPELEKYFGNL